MKHVKTFESVNEAAFKGQDAYEDAYEWIKYSLNIPHAEEIIGKLKRRFKSKPFSEDDVRQIMSESVNEAKDNLYLQLHKKYAEQIQGLKAKKIKKLTDLVSVQRWSMEDRDDYFDLTKQQKKEISAVFNDERKLFKQYMAGDHSVMLPESLNEAVNEAKSITREEIEKTLAAKKIELKYDYTFDRNGNLNFHQNKSTAKKAKDVLYKKGIETGPLVYLAGDNYIEVHNLEESVNEAADITSDQLDKFLKSKFKNKGDKETYDIVVTSQDSRNDDDDEDDYVTDVAIGYDVHTKAGHVRAEDDIFFDLDQQKWFDNWLNGGDMKSLPNVEKIIKKHIRDAKKQITG